LMTDSVRDGPNVDRYGFLATSFVFVDLSSGSMLK